MSHSVHFVFRISYWKRLFKSPVNVGKTWLIWHIIKIWCWCRYCCQGKTFLRSLFYANLNILHILHENMLSRLVIITHVSPCLPFFNCARQDIFKLFSDFFFCLHQDMYVVLLFAGWQPDTVPSPLRKCFKCFLSLQKQLLLFFLLPDCNWSTLWVAGRLWGMYRYIICLIL